MSVISRVETLPARLSTFDQPSEDVKDLHEVLPLLGSELKKDYGEKVCESEGGISEFSVMEKRVEVETVVPKDAQSEIRGLNSEEKENDDVCSKESLMKDLKTTLISYATELKTIPPELIAFHVHVRGIHFNGRAKPWLDITFPKLQHLWTKHVDYPYRAYEEKEPIFTHFFCSAATTKLVVPVIQRQRYPHLLYHEHPVHFLLRVDRPPDHRHPAHNNLQDGAPAAVGHQSGHRVFQHHSITGEMSVIHRVESLPARLSTFDQSSEDVKDLHEVLPLSGSELEKDYGKLAKNNLESDNFCSDAAGEKVCESEGGISEFSVVEKGVEVKTVVPKDAQSEIRGLDSEEKENDDVCSKESPMTDLETSLISYATELVND
ncbi:galacturonosyltransferase 12, partial [Striga asiatica]